MTSLWLILVLAAPTEVVTPDSIQPPSQAEQLLSGFLQKWESTKTAQFHFQKEERMRDGKLSDSTVKAILRRKPFAIYLYTLSPHEGQEVIYDSTKSKTELTVHPNRFPDFTLDLDIKGSLVTDNEHHIVTQIGFDYLIGLIKKETKKFDAQNKTASRSEHISYQGKRRVHGRSCDVIELKNVASKHFRALSKEDESLFDFSRRFEADPFMIFYLNPKIDDLSSTLDEGVWIVPRTYGSRTEILIDPQTRLPCQHSTWDHKGRLYERFTFTQMKVDFALPSRVFDT
ncbi:DUF1571 domain-containing protein, partial [Myxococcota bacterium]|nr:DUF1571 domain-containing protein [Myxococcota bacterium]